jgi:hypothetical protein
MSVVGDRTSIGRPPGEIRQLMVSALRQQGPMALRDLAAHTQVGYDSARWTLKRCVSAGVLVKAGAEKRPHSKNWVTLYDVAPEPDQQPEPRHGPGWVDLGRIVAGWAR